MLLCFFLSRSCCLLQLLLLCCCCLTCTGPSTGHDRPSGPFFLLRFLLHTCETEVVAGRSLNGVSLRSITLKISTLQTPPFMQVVTIPR